MTKNIECAKCKSLLTDDTGVAPCDPLEASSHEPRIGGEQCYSCRLVEMKNYPVQLIMQDILSCYAALTENDRMVILSRLGTYLKEPIP